MQIDYAYAIDYSYAVMLTVLETDTETNWNCKRHLIQSNWNISQSQKFVVYSWQGGCTYIMGNISLKVICEIYSHQSEWM